VPRLDFSSLHRGSKQPHRISAEIAGESLCDNGEALSGGDVHE